MKTSYPHHEAPGVSKIIMERRRHVGWRRFFGKDGKNAEDAFGRGPHFGGWKDDRV